MCREPQPQWVNDLQGLGALILIIALILALLEVWG